MPRMPFQVHIIPFRKAEDGNFEYAIFRRTDEPYWQGIAGGGEDGESLLEAAKREAFEEAGARLKKLNPFALFNLTFVNQVYLMFRGNLVDTNYQPGEESLEVQLMTEDEIPWDQIAFPVIRETLKRYFQDRETGRFSFHMGDILPGGKTQ